MCKSIYDGSNLDVIEIDAASNTGVDNIRDIIESRKPELERLNATNSRYQNAWGEIEEYNNSSTQRYGRSFL
jgi:hypothetical protein